MTENYSRGIADTFKNINKMFPSFGAGFNIDIIILLRNGWLTLETKTNLPQELIRLRYIL